MRPFADSTRTVQIAWYPANPDAKNLAFPSAFMSNDWYPDKGETKRGVGELPFAARTYNRRKAIPGATGAHVCGTADQFAGKARYNPLTSVTYRANGLPVCCGVADGAPGGLWMGGAAIVGYTQIPRTGGLFAGGAAEVEYVPGPVVGALLAGGAAEVEYVPGPAVGGAEFGGAAELWLTLTAPSAGTYRVVLVYAGALANYWIYSGTCAGLVEEFAGVAFGCVSFGQAINETFYLRLSAPGATSIVVTYEAGACA